ncbi:MAG TPA: PsbP-related protein [Candidatus Paceibacterota bacterium]|jgi:hypothetical protein|nr:PsbP-related protein [Candidatus Paceibacterota bacterium]
MKNNQKGFISLVLIGALVVVVAIGGYFVWSKKPSQSNQQQVSTTPASTSTLADWKTYTNTKYGFEFNYPSNLVLDEFGGVDGLGVKYFHVKLNTIEDKKFKCDGCDGPLTFFQVSYIMSKIGQGSCDLKDPLSHSSELNVGSVLWKKCFYEGGMNGPQLIMSHSPDNVSYYQIYAENYGGQYGVDHQKIVDQILSTFKFIEPTVANDISNWKTYTNDTYGFELKYPKELYLGSNPHGDGGLITISDKKDWETEAQNALLVISLNASTFPVKESSTDTSEKNFPISELKKKLNLDIKSNFQGDPPWGWFNVSIPLKTNSKFLSFNIRISNLDDVSYGGHNKYIRLASDILSTFKFIK